MATNGVKCYSIYPSQAQTPHPDPYVEVFQLNHPIPICESSSPVSSYRWHSFSEQDFIAYQTRLEEAVYKQMEEAEAKEGTTFSLAIAHHSFLNPVVLRNVIARRVKEGKPKTPLACFVHGTALKMHVNEKSQSLPQEFPLRFLPFIENENIFGNSAENGVQLCYTISQAQYDTFFSLFPKFSKDRVVILPNGINQSVFHEIRECTIQNTLGHFTTVPYSGSKYLPMTIDPTKYDSVVLFVGKLTMHVKRIQALLYAAKKYERSLQRTATLIVGGGPPEVQKALQDLVFEELKLQNTFFIGPQTQPVLAKLYSIASVGVFPSHEEAFGMVFVECMACGTPVIGADSGGPRDFVDSSVGMLIPEPSDPYNWEELSISLDVAIQRAIKEDWKSSLKEACKDLVDKRYSIKKQSLDLLDYARKILNIE